MNEWMINGSNQHSESLIQLGNWLIAYSLSKYELTHVETIWYNGKDKERIKN
jgi:hypothetical protein